LPDILYGCEIVSHTAGRTLKMVENMALRKIFGPKRETTRGCRKLHSEALHNLHLSPIMMTKSRMRDGHSI
jgi:hypothetical protein